MMVAGGQVENSWHKEKGFKFLGVSNHLEHMVREEQEGFSTTHTCLCEESSVSLKPMLGNGLTQVMVVSYYDLDFMWT